MYEIIGTRASRAIRVLWLAEELALDYTHIPAKPRSDEARAANPSGKIPALREGDAVITDSTAIMTYLADKHGALTAPAGTIARARQDAMTQTILDDLDGVLWTAARHSFILPEEHRVPEVKDSLKWEYARNIARIEDGLSGPFVMGEAMSVPDILLTHCLRWAGMAQFPAPGEKLTAYQERMQARPAFQKVIDMP
ncbi:glutathione S-transferase family protein [Roseovarius faecimaris]|uniref:Glutathione S-transferase family protein n=1 Tax=Roseovarius faecimaris TaxID=2494550 RepID=A0A6I6IQ74_9RHOB|nr:glutathione S-transferase family protein [Roseovarius faecimaris]QGX97617.1 glutathione S-transferase family protein [Roseovarius faecimaris]